MFVLNFVFSTVTKNEVTVTSDSSFILGNDILHSKNIRIKYCFTHSAFELP